MPLEILIPALIILGFILVLIEIFLVPGFNIFGIFGFIMIILGIFFAYTKLDSRIANFILIASLLISIILIRFIVKSKTWNRMILNTNEKRTEGFHASSDHLPALLGKRGVTYTRLRPAGIAMIDDEKVDVVAEGSFIDQNKPIEVIFVEGNRVVVRKIKSDVSDSE